MKNIKDKILRIYGNRGLFFDFIIGIIIFLILLFYNHKFNYLEFDKQFIISLLSFFGIFAGFMLTAFSLLLLYNPRKKDKPHFDKLRRSPAFKQVLKYFITAIFFILISVIIAFIILIKKVDIMEMILMFFIIFSFLIVIRCLYYLIGIIDFQ